jgi:hypothetical protein
VKGDRTERAHARLRGSANYRLLVAAVKYADALEQPEAAQGPDFHERFMAADEENREAALAFARPLTKADRERLGR